jgi:NAD-dependent dihydropyrimidine dehydrogenase PreA subunit
MIEKIDEILYKGCGTCAHTCPMDVIYIDEKSKKAKIVYQEDCCPELDPGRCPAIDRT